MPDNDLKNTTPENTTPENEGCRQSRSDRPLGTLSDFRGNSDNVDGTRSDKTAQRPETAEQTPSEQEQQWHSKEPPQDNSSRRDSGFEQDSPPPQPPADNHHRTGTGMYWAAALIALALLTLFFNNRIESKQLSEGITEKLLQQADGHYYARGQINSQPVLFIVDTGASVVSIPATLADSMGLPRLQPERVNTANGEVTVFNTRPVTIRLGDIQLYDVEAHINPGMAPPGVLLGMSFLRRLDFRQRDTRLILKTRPEL